MKNYYIKTSYKLIGIGMSFLFLLCFNYLLKFPNEFNAFYKFLLAPFVLVLCLVGLLSMYKTKIIIDKDKIQCFVDLIVIKIHQTVYLGEINSIDSDFFFIPQIGFITLYASNHTKYGSKESTYQKMDIMITMLPIELLQKILSQTKSNVHINLYSWLKKRINNERHL